MHSAGWRKRAVLVLASATLATSGCGLFDQQPLTSVSLQPAPTAESRVAGAAADRGGPVNVYRNHADSVVSITSSAVVRSVAGPMNQPQGTGSGFVLDEQGHIVTNNHVVEQADELSVTFADGTTTAATLVGRDPENDLAVIKVDPAADGQNQQSIQRLLEPVMLGDSDQVVIGEDAIAMGSPLGLRGSLTQGIVSAIRTPMEANRGQLDLLGGAIQTDAAINPGNSGGPLFNSEDQVIGVNTAILSQSGGNEGIGFAIPVNVVKRVAPELIRHGVYRHPYIGISALSLSQVGQAARRQLSIETDAEGLLVQSVSAGAAEAGLQAGERAVSLGGEQVRVGGDIIVGVDGREISTVGELRGYIENNKRPGDTVTLTVLRNDQRQDLTVTLGERPE